MKKVRRIVLILFLFLCLIYICNLQAIPDNIVLFEGENLNIPTLFGIEISKTQDVSSVIEGNSLGNSSAKKYSYDLNVSIANIKLKELEVNVLPKTSVVVSGNTIGAKLYTDGVLVVGMSEIEGNKPYEDSGIEEGDMIVEINKNTITCTADLIKKVNESNGSNLEIKYIREGHEHIANINPARTIQNEYKLGLWVRDAAAGVGTMTFYDPESSKFAALGHGIMDIDTGKLINISKGELVTSKVISIQKGQNGKPGEIRGTIENGISVGEIDKNTYFGIYGKLNNPSAMGINQNDTIEVANRDEIKTGKAYILANLDGTKQKKYEIQIEKIYYNNNTNNKSMLIKVIDDELKDKTGGIIQGMSGSPIVQNGKFVGAVTHVLVSDPTKGYAVFGDLMVKQIKN